MTGVSHVGAQSIDFSASTTFDEGAATSSALHQGQAKVKRHEVYKVPLHFNYTTQHFLLFTQ